VRRERRTEKEDPKSSEHEERACRREANPAERLRLVRSDVAVGSDGATIGARTCEASSIPT
jgi:hypothetical protein